VNVTLEIDTLSPTHFFLEIAKPDGQLLRQVRFYGSGEKVSLNNLSHKLNKKKIVEDGSFKQWYPNGTLHSTETYRMGLPSGEKIVYHSNGQREFLCIYDPPGFISELHSYTRTGREVNVNQYLDNKIYSKVDREPHFPKGETALRLYINQHINYPEEALKKGIVGEVVVGFVVDENGRIIDPEIEKSPSPLLSREAIRMVSHMPLWQPGFLAGYPVKSRTSVSIIFRAF
jgi:TonB family protein